MPVFRSAAPLNGEVLANIIPQVAVVAERFTPKNPLNHPCGVKIKKRFSQPLLLINLLQIIFFLIFVIDTR